MTRNDEIERQNFEQEIVKWWPEAKGHFELSDGEYNNHFLNYAWWGWLARSKQEGEAKLSEQSGCRKEDVQVDNDGIE